MKKIFYILLLISQTFWAQTDFEKGNALYQKGNYEQAISAYEKVTNEGKESSELYFNIANCYYKMNKVAPAIFNFEKALLLNPNDSEIKNNLSFAQKMTIDDIVEVPKVGFGKMIQDFTSNFCYDSWAWISIYLSVLVLLCFVGYYFSNTTFLKRIFFASMMFSILFVIIAIFAGFFEKSNDKNNRPAIVFADVVSIKSEPKTSAQDVFVLHAGTKVFVIESLNNFKKIQLSDLKEGWIEKSAIKELKN